MCIRDRWNVEHMELEEGAKIIINRWLKLKPWDRLMIVAGEKNLSLIHIWLGGSAVAVSFWIRDPKDGLK